MNCFLFAKYSFFLITVLHCSFVGNFLGANFFVSLSYTKNTVNLSIVATRRHTAVSTMTLVLTCQAVVWNHVFTCTTCSRLTI